MSLDDDNDGLIWPIPDDEEEGTMGENETKAWGYFSNLGKWEISVLNRTAEFGDACYEISRGQTSPSLSMKWLKISVNEGERKGIEPYAGLLYALHHEVEYMGDEAAWWMRQLDEEIRKKLIFDQSGSRARRFLTRLLLSGSLSKNQDSVIYRSFFHSGLREVHLLPLISKYLVEEKREEESEEEGEERQEVSSLLDISSIVFSSSSSSITSLTINMKYDNQFLCFLPLLFSLLPNLTRLELTSSGFIHRTDLSFLQQVNTSKLERLQISSCSFDSLSPLSLCDLSSLHSLTIKNFPERDGLHPLNGLSSDITRSLKTLRLVKCHLEGLSPLSDCDLSSLEHLDLTFNRSPSSLSPLRGSDLSSLKSLNLDGTNISDLSPLCECKGLALEELCLRETPFEDLSSLSLLDLSRLKNPINLTETKVSDLSPLENISYDGVVVSVYDTPIAKSMEEQGLNRYLKRGKVTVLW